jgi:predicted acetyltransferase
MSTTSTFDIGNLDIRTIKESDLEAFERQLARVFGYDPTSKEDPYDFRKILDLDRIFAAFDGDQIVGTCAAFTLELSVPGGKLAMGGTTMVAVLPTHRRRGLLHAMMRKHIDEIRNRGEALAGLWASESSIYQRYGFGSAAELYEMQANADKIDFIDPASQRTLRFIEPGEAREILPSVHDRVRAGQPGMIGRSAGRWELETFRDPESEREGFTAKCFVICEGADGVDGYAIYRQKEKWEDFPQGELQIVEVTGETPDARAALWRYLMNIDLYPSVKFWNMAVDDELPWLVSEPRRIERKLLDSLWLRLLDIPRALSSRAYSESGRVVLGVVDSFVPENDGNYELIVRGDSAECRRCERVADVHCQVDVLGALFLGGHRASTLARAGRISGDPATIALLDQMFAWSPRPWCSEEF